MKTSIHFWPYLAQFFLEWEMFQKYLQRKSNTHFTFSDLFSKIVPCMRYGGELLYRRPCQRWKYGACAFQAWHPRLQTHTFRISNITAFILQQLSHEHSSMLCYSTLLVLRNIWDLWGEAIIWTTVVPVCRDIKIPHSYFRKLYAFIHISRENFIGQFADSLFRL